MLAAWILLAATLAAFYIVAGYPLLLRYFPWRRAVPVRKDAAYRAPVSIIVAVYNGQQFIRAKLESLLGLDYPRELVQILVVSDGSTDATASIVESYASRGVTLIRVAKGGKAAALNAALPLATGEILFLTDVRQAIHPTALTHLVANFADPTVGAVSGALRYLNPDLSGEQTDLQLYWRYESWVRSLHSAIDSVFNTTGCITAIRRSLSAPIPPDTLVDDAVIPLRAFFAGSRVILDAEAVAYDYPTASGGEFRRRMRTMAGNWQVFARLPRLFSAADRMRLHFLSHKFARLLLPWIILVILGATLALPASPSKVFLLCDEVLLGLIAAIDPWLPQWFPLRRVASAARTFVTMNAAALLAISVFFVSPETLWRPTQVTVQSDSPDAAPRDAARSGR